MAQPLQLGVKPAKGPVPKAWSEWEHLQTLFYGGGIGGYALKVTGSSGACVGVNYSISWLGEGIKRIDIVWYGVHQALGKWLSTFPGETGKAKPPQL